MDRIDTNLFLGPCPIRSLRFEDDPIALQKYVGARRGIFTSFSALFHKDWAAGLGRDTGDWQDRPGAYLHGIANPSFSGWRRDFLRLREELPIISVKVFPDLHDYGIRHLRDAAKFALEQNLPLVFMRRLVDDRLVPAWWKPRPSPMTKVLRALQGLEVPYLILSNFQPKEIDELIASRTGAPFWRYEVGTFTPLSFWFSSLDESGASPQLIYGSGAPLYYPAGALSIERAGLSKSVTERILAGNAELCYGL